MPNFLNLENILEMDFKQMRCLQCAGGARATDDAIHLLVNNLVQFFSQFKKDPTHEQLKIYLDYMKKITTKINESEYDYYLKKYSKESPEHMKTMALGCLLKSFKDLPKRMQYWAASEEFGDTIRNSKNHIIAVKNLDKWASLHSQFQEEFSTSCQKKSFF